MEIQGFGPRAIQYLKKTASQTGKEHTFVNVNFKNFLLAFYFPSVAVLAAVLGAELLALPLAV